MMRVVERQQFDIHLQPIVSLPSRRAIGYEALSRFKACDPADRFHDAHSLGLGVPLELAALDKALRAVDLVVPAHLSVNLSPVAITDPRLWDVLRRPGRRLTRLVVEITEHDQVLDYRLLDEPLARLRSLGVRIAVDDVGSGYACLRHILRLRPELIKLDRELIAGIDADPAQRALVAALARFGKEMGANIVAEGVETAEEADTLMPLGVHLAQGFWFARPAPVDLIELEHRFAWERTEPPIVAYEADEFPVGARPDH